MHMSTHSRRGIRSFGVRPTARLVALRCASEALYGGDDEVDAVLPHLLRHVAVLPSAAHGNRGCGEAGCGAAGESARLDQRILHLLSQHLERGGLGLGHGCRPVGRARGYSRERPVGSRRRFTRALRWHAGCARAPGSLARNDWAKTLPGLYSANVFKTYVLSATNSYLLSPSKSRQGRLPKIGAPALTPRRQGRCSRAGR